MLTVKSGGFWILNFGKKYYEKVVLRNFKNWTKSVRDMLHMYINMYIHAFFIKTSVKLKLV